MIAADKLCYAMILVQGERMVVERLGRLHTIERPGWFIAIPIFDQIAYRVSL